MSLDVINAQGAQVEALKQAVAERNAVIQALASITGDRRFTPKQLEALEGTNVGWKANKDGTLVIHVKKGS